MDHEAEAWNLNEMEQNAKRKLAAVKNSTDLGLEPPRDGAEIYFSREELSAIEQLGGAAWGGGVRSPELGRNLLIIQRKIAQAIQGIDEL